MLPEQDAVIVMTSENKNMQGQLDLVWKHLLPAFGAQEASKGLSERLGHLKLALPPGSQTSPTAQKKRFKLAANELGLAEVAFDFSEEACTFTAESHRVVCGLSDWHRGEAAFPGTPPRLISGGKPKQTPLSKIAASAVWTDPQTLLLTWRYYETPHHDTLSCRFEGDGVTITFLNSITAMNPKAKDSRAPLKGTAV